MEDKCVYCSSVDGLEFHHILPRSLGGTDDPHNLIRVCSVHHSILHNMGMRGDLSTLTKVGLQKAKEKGVVLGPLLRISPEQLAVISEERKVNTLDALSDKYGYDRNTILRAVKKWNEDSTAYSAKYEAQSTARTIASLRNTAAVV